MLKGDEMPSVGKGPGDKTKTLFEKRAQYVAQGVSNHAPIFIENAKGAVVMDIDNNVYIDCSSGIGVVNVGHCESSVVEGIKKQAEKLIHSCFMVSMYEPYILLAEKIVKMTPGDFLKKAMFVNSGAEAVENAVKIAKAYTKKPGVISFECGYHGRTLLTMTLTSKVKPYKYGFGPFAPEVYKVPSAYCYRCRFGATYPGCSMRCLEHFESFFIAEADPSNIAAMVIEPVQGEGGFIVPPKEYLSGLANICKKNDIVFIADEVQTGFGRTGKMFAVENFDVAPDLMALAKSIAGGVPLSAVVGKAEIMDAPPKGRIGGTYGGNPIACVAGIAATSYIEANNLSERANQIGVFMTKRLNAFQDKYPSIGDVRSLGAMVGVEFVKNRKTKKPANDETPLIIQECFKRGLIVLGAGIFGNVIRFLPPLVITDRQVEKMMSIFEEALDAVYVSRK
ncbi:MAG: 4-aminobutyrate--2-oxoglutarate transaminase [Smithella sp.]|nr:4-aminobutyrate--2-oxoglutarate transaminase [Smithella sp.]